MKHDIFVTSEIVFLTFVFRSVVATLALVIQVGN